MSLYKAPETTLFFKTLSQKDQAHQPHLKPSREARILSKKLDLLSISDVVTIYEEQAINNELDESPQKISTKNIKARNEGIKIDNHKSQQSPQRKRDYDGSLKNQVLRKASQHHKDLVINTNQRLNEEQSIQMTRDLSSIMQEDVSKFIQRNTLRGIELQCNKVKELLGIHKKEQLLQHKWNQNQTQDGQIFNKTILNVRKSMDTIRRNSTLDTESNERPMTISMNKNLSQKYTRKIQKQKLNSTFQSISRDKRELILKPPSMIPAPGQYSLDLNGIKPNVGTVKFGSTTPIKGGRFDYRKFETLLWPVENEIRQNLQTHDSPRCIKCLKKKKDIIREIGLGNNEGISPKQNCDHKYQTQITSFKPEENLQQNTNIHSNQNNSQYNSPKRMINGNKSVGGGALNFDNQTARKPIIEGQMNPHDMRFTLEASKFPKIFSKSNHTQQINFEKYSKRDNANQLETNFTGFLHYQPEIPIHFSKGQKHVDQSPASLSSSITKKLYEFQNSNTPKFSTFSSKVAPQKAIQPLQRSDNSYQYQHQKFKSVFTAKKSSVDMKSNQTGNENTTTQKTRTQSQAFSIVDNNSNYGATNSLPSQIFSSASMFNNRNNQS